MKRAEHKSPAKKSLGDRKSATPDVLVANGGTVFTFCPLTDRAKTWIDDNVHTESYHRLGVVLVVEHRYAWALAVGMTDAGLILARERCFDSVH